ncbi:MAG: OmpA family protein [Pseudomonadota bacterium]
MEAKPAPSSGGGVVIGGRNTTIEKPNFRGVTAAGATARATQTVLGDGLVIPLTGAGRKSAGSNSGTETAAAQPAKSAQPSGTSSGYDLLVTFELSSDTLTPQAQTNLRQFAIALQTPELASLRFEVEGHTDATGSADQNLKLSERRAASVVSFLTELGVQGERLSAKGYGETRPLLADPNDPANRRVETRRLN